MKIKLRPADRYFSYCVRERADYRCEACGRKYEAGPGRRALHCSHFFSRRHKATRFDGLNAAAHCFTCHQALGEDPVRFARWIEEHIGAGALAILDEKHRQICKTSPGWWDEARDHYRHELKLMLLAREGGAQGRLEFQSWQ